MPRLLIIDGENFTGYIKANGGYKVTRNDGDSERAGRTMDYQMHRDRIAVKMKLEIACRALTGEETRKLLNAIYPEYITVTYYDPRVGVRDNIRFYSNNVPSEFLFEKPDGTEWWDGITFPLVEQ